MFSELLRTPPRGRQRPESRERDGAQAASLRRAAAGGWMAFSLQPWLEAPQLLFLDGFPQSANPLSSLLTDASNVESCVVNPFTPVLFPSLGLLGSAGVTPPPPAPLALPGAQPGFSLWRHLQSPTLSPAAILGHCPLSLSALPLPASVVPRHPLLPLAAPAFSPGPSLTMAGPGSARKPWQRPDGGCCEACVRVPTLSLSGQATLASLFLLSLMSPGKDGGSQENLQESHPGTGPGT